MTNRAFFVSLILKSDLLFFVLKNPYYGFVLANFITNFKYCFKFYQYLFVRMLMIKNDDVFYEKILNQLKGNVLNNVFIIRRSCQISKYIN